MIIVPVIRPDPAVHGCDRVFEDLYNEDTRLRAAAANPDTQVPSRLNNNNNSNNNFNAPHLSLQRHAEHLLVGPDAGQGRAPRPRPPVLLYPLPVMIMIKMIIIIRFF